MQCLTQQLPHMLTHYDTLWVLTYAAITNCLGLLSTCITTPSFIQLLVHQTKHRKKDIGFTSHVFPGASDFLLGYLFETTREYVETCR